MAPPIVLLLTVMPVAVGSALPVVVMTPLPVLVTFPVTVEFPMSMQVMAPGLVTALTDTPLSVRHEANAAGVPLPISSAATELDASSRRNLPLRSRTSPTMEKSPRRNGTTG
jgi:hypothetical protein